MAALNGRKARYGYRSLINDNRKSKRLEHKRIRRLEADEWQHDVLAELGIVEPDAWDWWD